MMTFREHAGRRSVRRQLASLAAGAVSAVIATALLCGCSLAQSDDSADGRLRVVATTAWHADLARRIGGEAIVVDGLMGPGVDPHLYTATAGDVETLAEADLVVRNGLELEGKMDRVFEHVAKTVPVVTVGEAVPVAERIPIEGVPGKEFDPHIWFAPGAWRHAARAVAEGLSEADPDHAETFARNLASFEREIERTEAEVQGLIATIPPRSRVLVTSHDAFSYFARAFGLEVASIQGKSTASEATTADIERVAEKVADAKLGAVFIESSVPQQTIDAVLASAKRRGQTAVEGGALYGDSMGDPESGEGSWAGALRYNAETIAAGLGSQVGDDR